MATGTPARPGDGDLPDYRDLPDDDGVKVAWGLWGDDDVLGCLNLLTPERAARGAGLVRRGAVFPLDAPLDAIDPPMFTRGALDHRVHGFPGGNAFDDHIGFMNTQASSQWDGFQHMRDPERGFYNDHDREALGIDVWARKGIVGRGVLADVAAWRRIEGRPVDPDGSSVIEPDDVTATLAAQGVEVEPGDVLLVRTGWLGWYRSLSPSEREAMRDRRDVPGLANHTGSAEMLWNLHVAAVAADNPALEAYPPVDGHLHWDLLPRLGIPIGELWSLDALADDCAADGVYDFLLTSSPLYLPGGVASPPNALAVK